MTWAAPLLGIIAAAIAIPALVILYFLKLRRRTVEVSSTLLWKKSIQDMQANAPFQKLRRNILLLLQLLVLAAALLALAQPRMAGDVGGGQRLVLMIDRSASMSATDDPDGRTRLERAKELALERIDGMAEPDVFTQQLTASRADEAMVVAFDSAGEILSPFTADKARLRDIIRSIEPSETATSIDEAFKLAQAQRPRRILLDDRGGTAEQAESVEVEGLVGGPPLSFHLFSDGRVPDLESVILREDAPQAAGDGFEYHTIGEPDAVNIGIVGLRAERDYENPAELSIFVSVQSTDIRPRTIDVELIVDGEGTASVRTLTLPAAEADAQAGGQSGGQGAGIQTPGSGGLVFTLDRPQGLIASVVLRTGDDPAADTLAVDNTGWLVVPPAERISVAVVTRGNFFISEAIAGLPLARLDRLTPSEYDSAIASGSAETYDVVVLDGHIPAGGLPPGRFLLMNAVPEPPFGVLETGTSGTTGILDWSRTHPALRELTLDGLLIARSKQVEVPDESSAIVLAQSAAGPAILELGDADRRALLVTFDVGESNWPFNVSFVVFLASSIDYLGGASGTPGAGGASQQLRPGEVLSARLPQGAAGVELVPPPSAGGESGAQDLSPAGDGSIAFGPVRNTGIFQVRWQGQAGPQDVEDGPRAVRFFAANLLDAEESMTRPAQALPLGSRQVSASSGRATAVRDYWPWLILAALAIMMLEWWIFNRKVYV
ncbi:MAG: VWA domain-containing protein [Planctomycetota bacterium]